MSLLFYSFTGLVQQSKDHEILKSVLPKTITQCKLVGNKQSAFLKMESMEVATANAIYASKDEIIEINIFEYINSKEAYNQSIKDLINYKDSKVRNENYSLLDLSGKEVLIILLYWLLGVVNM